MTGDPQCPEALFNPMTGSLRRCVLGAHAGLDLHAWHEAKDGTRWRLPETELEEDPAWAPPF